MPFLVVNDLSKFVYAWYVVCGFTLDSVAPSRVGDTVISGLGNLTQFRELSFFVY